MEKYKMEMEDGEMISAYDNCGKYSTYESLQTGTYGPKK